MELVAAHAQNILRERYLRAFQQADRAEHSWDEHSEGAYLDEASARLT